MIDQTPSATITPESRRRHRAKYWRITLILLVALGLNLAVLAIPREWLESLRGRPVLGYIAAFIITALANASVVVPIPYPSFIAVLAGVVRSNIGIALAGAAGSTLGESTAFLVGRAGQGVVEDTRFYRWIKRQLSTRLRAFVVLFLLSAPPNPFFDIAGLTAGSLGVPFWLFLLATFLGRIIKMLIFVGVGREFFQ